MNGLNPGMVIDNVNLLKIICRLNLDTFWSRKLNSVTQPEDTSRRLYKQVKFRVYQTNRYYYVCVCLRV